MDALGQPLLAHIAREIVSLSVSHPEVAVAIDSVPERIHVAVCIRGFHDLLNQQITKAAIPFAVEALPERFVFGDADDAGPVRTNLRVVDVLNE